jgi:succinoglycan biosynthesis transport protein ExoP
MPEQQTPNLQEVSQLQTQLQVNAEALNRVDMERTLLMRGVDPAALASLAKGAAPLTERARLEVERQQLKQQLRDMERHYTAAHPAVRDAATRLQQVEEQIKTLPPDPVVSEDSQDNSPAAVRLQLLDREAKRLTADQARITSQITAYRGKIEAVPVREQQMAELDRNYSITKEHYQSLLDKTFYAGMAADLERKQQAEHFTILDAAQVPERPFKPKRMLMLGAAFLAALAFSIGLAWFRDSMDSSLKVERQLQAMLPANVPLLTAIPNLPDSATRRHTLRLAVLATLVTLIGCALELGLFINLHPIL